ncbi:PEP-CTERM sorting domain-containing protein [Bythopirellula goksoeyrii]|uniref:PEP-CTERM motif protein n=1 Tax=Bythopirellula goksoeyrii TaxID=1400387 RepID=A0A5B9QCS2_9BACT|nr:PEP-CTERM sorting domain-containing protein [Bythopirellula goksoeyrii]QEG34746.1 PEP-CTERM motif protein [Bythopirellula goksoeyrii]
MKPQRKTTLKGKQKPRRSKHFAKRLTCYTTAAGLGAFAYGETAQALVIHHDVEPDLAATLIDMDQGLVGDYYIDMNGDGIDDFRIRYQIAGYDLAAIRFQGVGYSEELSNTDKGSNYYVRSFELGDSIGPGAVTTSTGYGIVAPNYTNFGATDTENYPQFAGIRIDIGGMTHYGWVRMQVTPLEDFTPVAPLTATIFDWAYETDPDTAIIAGDVGSFIPGDFDDDGDVDGADLNQWQGDYGVNGGSDADVDGDSDGRDFLIWQRSYTGPMLVASSTSIPEPTSLALLAAGGGALALKRRRRT